MTKNAYLGPILDVFGPNILIFMGVSKSFGTHIMEKPPRQLVRIFFGSGIRSNGPNLAVFGPKIHFFGGREYNFWYLRVGNPMRHLFCVENIDR